MSSLPNSVRIDKRTLINGIMSVLWQLSIASVLVLGYLNIYLTVKRIYNNADVGISYLYFCITLKIVFRPTSSS